MEQNHFCKIYLGRPKMCWKDVIKKDVELLGGGSGDCQQCKEKERGLDVRWYGFNDPMNANKKFMRTENYV